QPVLAIWGTRDDQMPIHASAAALSAALAAGPNRDRTFRTFDATHGGVVSYRAGEPHFAPGLLEETARWLGLHLGVHRAAPVIHTPRPPADHPKPIDVANASTVYSVPVRALWLLLPALMLVVATMRARARTRTLIAIGVISGVAMLAAIAAGVAAVLDHAGHVGRIAGTPWPFALAFVLAAACAVVALVLARRRAFLAAAACGIWIALALFVLL
ncbi:MAG TPA: hypothetical protein VM712_05890, partial [Gaiellales bacterium]|nr:hypothetical protein [Gaiellales bacterium]